MASDRYVALGIAAPRSTWFTDVARWSTVGSVPLEFVKCVSADELRARLSSGRPFSVVLADGGSGAVDRDLLELAAGLSVAVIVIDDGRGGRDWLALGARAVLSAPFTREQLIDTLEHTSVRIGGAAELPIDDPVPPSTPSSRGRLIAVMGAGGTGTSSVAVALAQGMADDSSDGSVVLADLALHADQAMLHDARDVMPGIQELVGAHRRARPSSADVRSLTFTVVNRRYQLLLGLRRHRDWTVLRPRSFEAALDALQRTFAVVVADVEPDVEGEAETGSVEVEERNLMARTVCQQADVVAVVGSPGVKGMHAQVRIVNDLREFGVAPDRVLAVVSRASRSQRARAEWQRAFADLTGATTGRAPVVGPVFLPLLRGLDERHRDGVRIPGALANPLAAATQAILAGPDPARVAAAPVRIRPGALGGWVDAQVAGS